MPEICGESADFARQKPSELLRFPYALRTMADEMDASIIRAGVVMRHTGISTQSFA